MKATFETLDGLVAEAEIPINCVNELFFKRSCRTKSPNLAMDMNPVSSIKIRTYERVGYLHFKEIEHEV